MSSSVKNFGARCAAYVKWHYTDVTLRRTEKQIQREQKLLGLIPFNRWYLVPAAVAVQLCIGSLYSWSIFNIPIETDLGLSSGTAANTFYIAVGFFGFSAALFGPVLERRGPQIILLFSTTMMFAGHLFAALGAWQNSIGCIYFGYGVLGGIGFGVSYITPVSPLQKWFPDYKGLLSGLAVCGFGGGSMIASKVDNALIKSQGVALTFLIIGSVYAVIMYCCVLVLRCPPPGYYVESPEERRLRAEQEKFRRELGALNDLRGQSQTAVMAIPATTMAADELKKVPTDGAICVPAGDANVVDIRNSNMSVSTLKEPSMKFTLLQALFSYDYMCMYVTLACNSCAGLMILSKMSDIMQQQFNQDKDFASTIVMVNSGFNLLGRLVYGAMSDKIGQKPIFVTSLFCQAVIMGVLPSLLHSDSMWAFITLIWILATFYGGGFGLMPAFLTAQFGSSNIGALHGCILTAWSLVGVIGGLSFTAIFKSQVSKYGDDGGKTNPYVYDLNFYIICGFIAFGFFFALFIRVRMQDRLLPRRQGELIKIPFFTRPIIIGYKTKDQQAAEWLAYLRALPENNANGSVDIDDDTSNTASTTAAPLPDGAHQV